MEIRIEERNAIQSRRKKELNMKNQFNSNSEKEHSLVLNCRRQKKDNFCAFFQKYFELWVNLKLLSVQFKMNLLKINSDFWSVDISDFTSIQVNYPWQFHSVQCFSFWTELSKYSKMVHQEGWSTGPILEIFGSYSRML